MVTEANVRITLMTLFQHSSGEDPREYPLERAINMMPMMPLENPQNMIQFQNRGTSVFMISRLMCCLCIDRAGILMNDTHVSR